MSSTRRETPLLLAANKGHAEVISALTIAGADLTVSTSDTGETVLHCILKNGRRNDPCYLASLQAILSPEGANSAQVAAIVNRRDLLGNTALHYATQMWPQDVVRSLLDAGANIGMRNHWHETPVAKILPATLEAYLDEVSFKMKMYNPALARFC